MYYFHRCQGFDDALPPSESGSFSKATADTFAESKHILLADDEDRSRRIFCHYLTGWGYSVIEARDGLEAAALGSPEMPHIMVIDWVMLGEVPTGPEAGADDSSLGRAMSPKGAHG